MLQAHPHAIHFKHILYFGEGQVSYSRFSVSLYGPDIAQSPNFLGELGVFCHPESSAPAQHPNILRGLCWL